ncbi:uncharacterized protein E0L32_007136 [Thyridium curvatum]|uniref:Uncharacterized protein n=1 Tax=Thyridium curvatum TaxID=1093900 RepID=A0A507B6I8_9PEZI|nr:uncharacterized protein E0L32_007136 [Thyridium curvatum]TPX12250.1 hypothetical protein E0L32_007136 [Thyridium curvatum]
MEEKAGETSKPKQDEPKATAPAAPAATQAPAAPASTTAAPAEDVPDPDEDDLDDLDDMLDEFSTVKLAPKEPEPAPASGPGRPAAAAAVAAAAPAAPATDGPADPVLDPEAALSEEDFAQQLQAGMADLLGEMENSPEVQAQFESFFSQFSAAGGDGLGGGGAAAGASTAAGAASGAAAGAEASFQETIRRTMERMQNSGDQATAAATAGGSDDFMAELMKQMGGGLEGGEGGEEDFSKMLLGMMEQLTNKEILYEPMKELHEKFPDWMEKNKDKTPEEDMKRYEEQQLLVKEIVAKFEEPTYADSNAADREYIVDRMQKADTRKQMQAAGSPPSDLVGDMPSAQDAFGGPDESCNPQ